MAPSREQTTAGVREFFVVPHTHWDREWYRPFDDFLIWLGHVVDGVIETLERDPAFSSFTLDGQAVVLEDYLAIRPANESRLRELIGAGRIEVGPSYVLPDELLVGEEALVRNLLIGRAVCERFGAEPSPVGYMPDSFGHPAQIPQLLAGFGIGNFIFSRGLGDQLDEVGVVFRWRAPDGSKVLAFQQLPNYGNFGALNGPDDGETRVKAILEGAGAMLEGAGVHAGLLCNGSDHLPIQPEMPVWCTELERRFPGIRFRIAKYADYVIEVGEVDVPSLSGELLGSRIQNALRGVNSARLYLKQANDRAERRVLATETLAALRLLHDRRPFPTADFDLAWRELLRNHPHDSICGCSCDEVHRDMLVRYEWLHRTLDELERGALDGLEGIEGATTVTAFNPLPRARRCLVRADGHAPAVVELGGFSAQRVVLEPADEPAPRPGTAIESDRLALQAAPDGTLTLLDKLTGVRLEGLHALEDEPDMGDLYNFCPVEDAPHWRAARAEVQVLAGGPVVWELELRVEAELPAGIEADERVVVPVRTVARLVAGSGRVEFRTTIENTARDHRLRVVFPVGAVADELVRAQSAFALVRRPLRPPEPVAWWAEPPDPTQHMLGAVALGPLAVMSRGLPEYEARPGDDGAELCLTLLRCVGVIAKPPGELTTRPLGAGPAIPTPEGQCLGTHQLEYSIRCDAGELDDLALVRESQDYRFASVQLPSTVELEAPLRVEGEVAFSCLKGAQDGDGLILRCFNPSMSPAIVRVLGEVSVSRTALDETGEEAAADGAVEIAPSQIATLRLRPA